MTMHKPPRRVVVVDGARRYTVTLKPADFIASGATGDVYRLRGHSHGHGKACIKLYRTPDSHSANKLTAMIERPPVDIRQHHAGKDFIRFAWPSHQVEDGNGSVIGFVMPEIDFQRTRSMVTYTERRESQRFLTPEQRSLPRRLALCANLCALMSDLHSQGHAFVDFKDQNVRVYPDQDLVGFIDTDGFRIQGHGNRCFPGQHTTPTFNSPESVNGPKSALGEHHDHFVLAILLFRILNMGVHPFQGIPKNSTHNPGTAFSVDDHIAGQIYPYGAHACQGLAPTQGSLHGLWGSRTLAMFEQTFTTRTPGERVSAHDWMIHFRELQRKGLARCQNHPSNIEHVHFAGNRCPICAVNESATPSSIPTPASPPSQSMQVTGLQAGGLPQAATLPPPEPRWHPGARFFLATLIAVATLAAVGIAL